MIFRLFQRRSKAANEMIAAVGNLFEPNALLLAIAELLPRYQMAVSAGECLTPASGRRLGDPRASVREIWEDTRLEALSPFFQHGTAALTMLTNVATQADLFDALMRDGYYFKTDQSVAGDDSIRYIFQAAAQCFSYLKSQCFSVGTSYEILHEVENIVKIRRTEREFRNTKFLTRCAAARDWWQQDGVGPEAYKILSCSGRPPMMFYLLWEEVTTVSKEIASACIYGSSLDKALESEINWARKRFSNDVIEQEKMIAMLKASIVRLKAANDPDDLLQK